ncbi:GspH/FimT family protein [Thermoactinomyces mirandus]|uniref:GspH/FimT family protein n=1 Tax=Thermoactinomyces mirandus TaxID=2756294 RepID=A0A7W1XUC9_9BACL|nr:GspH/FimT family protein [Thermoactinomyces mirandus]MBA4603462.1 GspH/FimT family protein [Thermoactinomyces mirandus]
MIKNRPGNRGEAGWSLIETVFTLFLFGLLFSLCMPAISVIAERVERMLLMQELASRLQLAQTEAMSKETEVTVRLVSAQNEVHIVQNETVLRKIRIPPLYRLTSNYPRQSFVYRETGQVQGGTLSLYSGKRLVGRLVIQVASGLPKVEMVSCAL